MTSLKQAQPARSAPHKAQDQSLAVLSRSNHDMRSPLSVILGVLELLEDTANLEESERRYLKLGRDAANDLVELADALRLYTGISRGSVTVDCAPTDVFEPVREVVAEALADRDVSFSATPPAGPLSANCDIGYLTLAFAALARFLASNLVDAPEAGTHLSLTAVAAGDQVRLHLAPTGRRPCEHAETLAAVPGEESIALSNAINLVRQMNGEVRHDPQLPGLSVELPAAH